MRYCASHHGGNGKIITLCVLHSILFAEDIGGSNFFNNMALSLQESFDRSCRLCAEEQEVTIMIFSAEAEAMFLQNKLNKYLLIEIEEDDKLPKNICLKCCTKLHTVCDFIDTARKSQEILMSRSILLDQVSCDMSIEPTIHSKSDIKQEPMAFFDDDGTFTPMEVSVDPMMVLQNCEAGCILSPREEDDSQCETDDVSYLHGLDGENVTIKLIRKGDQQSDPMELLEEKKKSEVIAKPFPCVVCKRSFYTELALKNHTWIHSLEDSDSKQFKCHSCPSEFDYRIDFINHLKEHRTSSTCKVCGRVFRSEANLGLHMESHSSPYNAHICKICGRAYNSGSNLKTHSITHSNERPFECHLCKKSFKRNQDLKFHINQHTGAKPYQCPFCDKSFASSGNCYSHRSRMHPGRRIEGKSHSRGRIRLGEHRNQPRPPAPKLPMISVKGVYKFQCQICEATFIRRDNYTYHMYQHTGEKPFQCSLCDDKFVTRRGLLIHHDKEHPGKERPLSLLTKNILLK